MKRTLAAMTALSLCLPALAVAQPDHDRRGQADGPQAGPQGGKPEAARPQQNEPRGRDGGFLGRVTPNQAAPAPNQTRQGPNLAEERRDDRDRREDNRDRREDNRDRREDRRDAERGRDFRDDRDRGDARRFFNFRGRQYNAVRGPVFHYPRGWSYRHWNRGEVLPRLFISDAFFLDYAFLGLPPPLRGTRWVRYGPDALLVSAYDGRIVDVIYDAFY